MVLAVAVWGGSNRIAPGGRGGVIRSLFEDLRLGKRCGYGEKQEAIDT